MIPRLGGSRANEPDDRGPRADPDCVWDADLSGWVKFGVPELTWRGWQARARAGEPVKGPKVGTGPGSGPATGARRAVGASGVGHRKIWAMVRHAGHAVSQATVLPIVREEGLGQSAGINASRASSSSSTRPRSRCRRRVRTTCGSWTSASSRTTSGGTWRIAGCRATGPSTSIRHVPPTANQFDAIEAVERALADYEALLDHPIVEDCPVDLETDGAVVGGHHRPRQRRPVPAIPVRGLCLQTPRARHAWIGVSTPDQNGSRERGFGTLKYERLYIEEIDDAVMLAKRAEDFRINYNEMGPHEALVWNRPKEVHLGTADPTIPNLNGRNSCQLLDPGQCVTNFDTKCPHWSDAQVVRRRRRLPPVGDGPPFAGSSGPWRSDAPRRPGCLRCGLASCSRPAR